MQAAGAWLLDTGILLHWIRASKAAEAIDAQANLRDSPDLLPAASPLMFIPHAHTAMDRQRCRRQTP
jgi:hypothetical protein